jgi:hypothetical protein
MRLGWLGELEVGLLNAAALVYPCFINSHYCHAMPGLQDEAWRRFDPLPSLRAQLDKARRLDLFLDLGIAAALVAFSCVALLWLGF